MVPPTDDTPDPSIPPSMRVTAEHSPARATAEFAAFADAQRGTPSGTPSGMRAVAGRGPRIGLRLFGIAGMEPSARGTTAPLAADTELVTYRDVGAIVEPATYAAEPVGTVALERHRTVVDDVFARRSIVPAPPGTVFRSRDALAGWLELHYYTLVEALAFVEDRAVARVAIAWASSAELSPQRAAPLHLGPDTPDEGTTEADALVAEASEPFQALRREAVSLLVLADRRPRRARRGLRLVPRGARALDAVRAGGRARGAAPARAAAAPERTVAAVRLRADAVPRLSAGASLRSASRRRSSPRTSPTAPPSAPSAPAVMFCPDCGTWNRATLPRCMRCAARAARGAAARRRSRRRTTR